LTSSTIAKIRDISPPDSDGDSLFIDTYRGHQAYAWVLATDKGTKVSRKFTIIFDYSLGRGKRSEKKAPPIGDLIDVVSIIKKRPTFQCQVYFDFGKRMKPKSLVRLPIDYTEFTSMPFDRIQGVHLVKLDGEAIKYEVILEAPTKGRISANIIFNCKQKIERALADNILKEAETIAAKFMLWEKQDGKNT
jgi:hypothetical protein